MFAKTGGEDIDDGDRVAGEAPKRDCSEPWPLGMDGEGAAVVTVEPN